MIHAISIRNFKAFDTLEVELPPFAVVAGPNNSGKSTLLQAIATWSELANLWKNENPDLAREDDRNFPSFEINIAKLRSLSVADSSGIWKDRQVQSSVSLGVRANDWDRAITFELIHGSREVVSVRPTKETLESDLESYMRVPVTAMYVSASSGIAREESEYAPRTVLSYLANGRGGEVLRTMLTAVSEDSDDGKWEELCRTIYSFFGYELLRPSVSTTIYARYRHDSDGQSYDLSNAASGVLQLLMVQAALLYEDSSILLIDEPDAHLHASLKDKMYRHLREHAELNNRQTIIATHSTRMINAVAHEDERNLLFVWRDKIAPISRRKASDIMVLEHEYVLHAEMEKAVLYLEGRTDLDILREWARVLEHRAQKILDAPFYVETGQKKGGQKFSKDHFESLRYMVWTLRGLEIRDGNSRTEEEKSLQIERAPEGLVLIFWRRYEIENYLVHPLALKRFLMTRHGVQNADEHIRMYVSGIYYQEPFVFVPGEGKGSDIIDNIMRHAGVKINKSQYYMIAAQMEKSEIHPDIEEALDRIADHFL